MFLINSGKKARNVLECDKRNVETIAKPHETGRFYGCVDVQNSCEKGWLICHDPDRITAETGKTDHDVWCVMLLQLKKISLIDNIMNNIANIVRLGRSFGHHRIELLVRSVAWVIGGNKRRAFHVVGWYKRQQFSGKAQCMFI